MGKDMVNHPPHYEGKVECIDALESATAGLEGIEAVDTANAIKYLWRWKKKNGKEDLKKAIWYIKHLLKTLGEPEDKPLPQPQISDICSMSPDAFVREYVHGSGSVIGLKAYSGHEEFVLFSAGFTPGRGKESLIKVNLEFVKNCTERPNHFSRVKGNNSVIVNLVEQVRM